MMGTHRRPIGGSDTDTDTAKAANSPATMPDPSDSAVDEHATLRLFQRSKPWVRDRQCGSGNVEVAG